MSDYKNGKVYRLVDNETGAQYIGGTTQLLCSRKNNHKQSYKAWVKAGKPSRLYCYSFQIVERNNFSIVLIENYPCNSKAELDVRERHYIETMPCVNHNIPSRSKQEYREATKEQKKETDKQYREKNRERLIEYSKRYYEQNKDEINEKRKQHYEEHKDEINERRRDQYIENHDVIREQRKKEYAENEKAQQKARERASEQYAKLRSTEEGKEILKERGKRYFNENKEVILEKQKAKRLANIDEYKKKEAERREKLRSQQTDCGCGGTYNELTKFNHIKTKKHLKWLETLS